MEKIKIGIIGPGNIGSDLMFKVMKSKHLEMRMMAGRRVSEGIKRAEGLGFKTSIEAAEGIASDPEIKIVFDATSAKAHEAAAPVLKEAGNYRHRPDTRRGGALCGALCQSGQAYRRT